MNYVSSARRPNPAAAMGALGVPAAFGALLVLGLAITATIPDEDTGLTGIFIPTTPIDDPPAPDPIPDTPTTASTAQPKPDRTMTPPPRPAGPVTVNLGNTGPLTLPQPGTGLGLDGVDTGPIGLPSPLPTFDPILATPRGNPGSWITDADYRSTWINRGFEGVAGFALQLDRRGRVSDCSITRSTGYSALDEATCRLLSRRARFEPARDANGNAIPGNYSSSVSWSIPE